jgi:hypothetical protein
MSIQQLQRSWAVRGAQHLVAKLGHHLDRGMIAFLRATLLFSSLRTPWLTRTEPSIGLKTDSSIDNFSR